MSQMINPFPISPNLESQRLELETVKFMDKHMNGEVRKVNINWKLISQSNQDLGYITVKYFEDKNHCHIEVFDCNLSTDKLFSDINYKMALTQLREQIEPQGYKIACNGCLPNIVYSGMLLNSSLGLRAYLVTDINKPVDITNTVKCFDSSPTHIWTDLATLDDQRKFRKLYFESGKKNSDEWSKIAQKNRKSIISNSRLIKARKDYENKLDK